MVKPIFKRILCLAILSLLFLTMVACAPQEEEPPSVEPSASASLSAAEEAKQKYEEEVAAVATPPVVTATPGVDEPMEYQDPNRLTVEYYDPVSGQTVTKEYQTDGQGSKEAALDAVRQILLPDILQGKELEINAVTYTDGNVFIDFKKSIYDLGMRSTDEAVVLDGIADAYLNNVEGIKGVYYSVEGEPYTSEHISIPKDYPYKENY